MKRVLPLSLPVLLAAFAADARPFGCSDIVGHVFDDRNVDGYRGEDERGLPGVRIATLQGWLVTTDQHGRFHIACADASSGRIGSGFLVKLDARTLPSGYRLTTENPRLMRLTPGKAVTLDFGAAVVRRQVTARGAHGKPWLSRWARRLRAAK